MKRAFFLIFFTILSVSLCCLDTREQNTRRVSVKLDKIFTLSPGTFKLIPHYNQALQDCLNFPLLAGNLEAVKLFRTGQGEEALSLLENTIAANPRYYNSYFLRANIYYTSGRFDKALEDYNELTGLLPEVPWAFFYRGLLREKLGLLTEAEADFKKAVSLKPSFPEPYEKLGDLYFDKGNYLAASIQFSTAINMASRDPALYFKRGRNYYKNGAFKSALWDLSKAIMLRKDYSDALFFRARVYAESKQYISAFSDLNALPDASRKGAGYLALRSETNFYLNGREAYKNDLMKLIKKHPGYINEYLEGNRELVHGKAFRKASFFTAEHPMKILLAGDSMAGGGLLYTLVNSTKPYKMINLVGKYKVSSGLTNINFYNWKEKIQEILKTGPFDLIIVIMGTNDAQGMIWENKHYRYGSDQWIEIYTTRVRDFISTLAGHATKVYWIGMPPMIKPGFHNKMARLNVIFSSACSEQPNAEFISTFDILGTAEGQYRQYIDVRGIKKPTRYKDHVHFTMDGIRPLGEWTMNMINKDFFIYLPGEVTGE